MSTHIRIDIPEEVDRLLSDLCEFCNASPGEPCIITLPPFKGQYICPDANCEQLYQQAGDALNCQHIEVASDLDSPTAISLREHPMEAGQ